MDLNSYHRDVMKRYADKDFTNQMDTFLQSYSKTHNIYFYVNAEPEDNKKFTEDLLRIDCHVIGVFYMTDSTPCTVVFIPKLNEKFLSLDILKEGNMHIITTDIVCLKGKNKQDKLSVLNRMFDEHKRMFKHYFIM